MGLTVAAGRGRLLPRLGRIRSHGMLSVRLLTSVQFAPIRPTAAEEPLSGQHSADPLPRHAQRWHRSILEALARHFPRHVLTRDMLQPILMLMEPHRASDAEIRLGTC